MARYEDYAKAQPDDALEQEIDSAAEAAKTRQEEPADTGFAMPEQFSGKTPEEIAKSYLELQKLHGRQTNELGELRRAVDDVLRTQSTPEPSKPERKPVTIDALYDNADEAIESVVERTAGDRIERLERELEQARVERVQGSLEKDFPNWQESVQAPEFVEFVRERPYLRGTLEAADRYDLGAARELLTMYDSHKKSVNPESRKTALRDAALETSTPGSPRSEESFSRRELIDYRARAMHGDTAAIEFLRKNNSRIAEAYQEGRVTP